MEWIVEAESLSDFVDHGRYTIASKPLIRCKNCKYWKDQEYGGVEVQICARPQNRFEKFPLVMLIDRDGFCSYGKRRTDEC